MIIQKFFKDSQEKVLITHGNCSDGFGAAWAVWKEYGDTVKYHHATHSDEPLLYKDKTILFTDFAYEADVMRHLGKHNDVFVIDHHIYAMENLKDFPNTLFDMSKSGAVLAWESLYPDVPVPLLLKYVEDRDLRNFKLPYTHEVLSVLDTIPQTFKNWSLFSNVLDNNFAGVVEKGKALKSQFDVILNKIIQEAQPVYIDGHQGLVVNANWDFASYAADKLSEKAEFGMAWFMNKEGLVKCSFRSSHGLNVNNLAQTLGGGGHAFCAGATLTLEKLNEVLEKKEPELSYRRRLRAR